MISSYQFAQQVTEISCTPIQLLVVKYGIEPVSNDSRDLNSQVDVAAVPRDTRMFILGRDKCQCGTSPQGCWSPQKAIRMSSLALFFFSIAERNHELRGSLRKPMDLKLVTWTD